MPAKNLQRVSEGGVYCHVYNKGIENRAIFVDEEDYNKFKSYLEEYLSAPMPSEAAKKDFTINGRLYRGIPHQPKNYLQKIELLAYNLKPDHFHLLLHQKTNKSLQAFIRSLCTRYSIYFNKKYKRSGPLFEGPYKSVQLKNDTGLLLLTRYFHEAGGYSSHHEYSGKKETSWVKTKVALSIKNPKENYRDFIENYEPSGEEKSLLAKISLDRHDLERIDPVEINHKYSYRFPEIIIATAGFLLLLGLGARNIYVTRTQTTLGAKTHITTPSPSPTPKAQGNTGKDTQTEIQNK